MTVVNFLKNEVEILTINDLLEFFIQEEICEEHREQLLNIKAEVTYNRHTVLVKESNEEWTVISKSSDEKLLLLFSNTSKVVFYNKSVIASLVMDEFIRVNQMNRSFYLIAGMYNNTGQSMIGGYKAIDSVYFNRMVRHHLFHEINQEFTKKNQELLIAEGLKTFEKLSSHQTESDLKEWENDALKLFLCNKKPREVLYHVTNDFSGVEDFLTTKNVMSTFAYVNRGKRHLESLKAQASVSYYEIQDNFRAFMTQELYRGREADWLENLDYLAVRQISKLEQEGKLNQKGRQLNEPIHFEVILKGETKKKEAWISSPTKSQGYQFQKSLSPLTFTLKRYAPTNEFLSFELIQTIFVDGREVFDYDKFVASLEVKAEFDKMLADEDSLGAKKTPSGFKALVVEATENLSKKAKMIEGQLALNLF